MFDQLTRQTESAIVEARRGVGTTDTDDATAAPLGALAAVALQIHRLGVDIIRSTTSALRDPRVR